MSTFPKTSGEIDTTTELNKLWEKRKEELPIKVVQYFDSKLPQIKAFIFIGHGIRWNDFLKIAPNKDFIYLKELDEKNMTEMEEQENNPEYFWERHNREEEEHIRRQLQDDRVKELLSITMRTTNYAFLFTAVNDDMEELLRLLDCMTDQMQKFFLMIIEDIGKDEPVVNSRLNPLLIQHETSVEIQSDLNSAIILLSYGLYKQAIAQLRNVLEFLVLELVLLFTTETTNWEKGTQGISGFTGLLKVVKNAGIIDDKLYGEIYDLYFDYMSTATHSHRSRMNAVRTEQIGFDKLRFYEFVGTLLLLSEAMLKLFDCGARRLNGRINTKVFEQCFSGTYKKRLSNYKKDIIEHEICLSSGKKILQRAKLKRIKPKSKELRIEFESKFRIITSDKQTEFRFLNEIPYSELDLKERDELVELYMIGDTEYTDIEEQEQFFKELAETHGLAMKDNR